MDRPLSQQFYWDKQQFEYWVQRILAVIGEHGDKIAKSNEDIANAINNLAEAIREAGQEL